MELEWSVSEAGVVFSINGQVAQYSRDAALVICQDIAREAEESALANPTPPPAAEKAGEIVSLTAEELAALKAAAGQ
jgi:hypothetical protein